MWFPPQCHRPHQPRPHRSGRWRGGCEDAGMAPRTETRLGVCNLCEAICGLQLTLTDGRVTGVRGNPDDPLSRGHICPKGVAIADVYDDPDRLRRPVRRVVDAATGETSWQRDRLGRGVRPRRRRSRRRGQHARPQRARHLPRQPQRAQPRLAHPRGRPGQELPHAQQVQRHVGRPAAAAVRRLADVRSPAPAADPGPRPDLLLPGVRRQPDGLQRVADDRARLPATGCVR